MTDKIVSINGGEVIPEEKEKLPPEVKEYLLEVIESLRKGVEENEIFELIYAGVSYDSKSLIGSYGVSIDPMKTLGILHYLTDAYNTEVVFPHLNPGVFDELD